MRSRSCPILYFVFASTAATVVAAEPLRWTPAAIASADYESSPAFTPDGRELFFMRADPSFRNYRLLHARCTAGGWSPPEPPPFALALPVLEGDPSVAADGRRVYFISSRKAVAEGRGNEDFDIWYAERGADGEWSSLPQRVPEPVSSPSAELLPRPAAGGRLYFGSDRPGGRGGNDIWLATERGGGWTVENLGAPVNSTQAEYEADISRDGRSLVVVADRGDRSHLYRFRRTRGEWRELGRIDARPDVFQVGPLLSPTADRLLFAQATSDASGELFVVDLEADARDGWPPACVPAAESR